MLTARRAGKCWQQSEYLKSSRYEWSESLLRLAFLGLCFVFLSAGCGQSVKSTTSSPTTQAQVDSYFGGPFSIPGSDLGRSSSTFDHTANQVSVSSIISKSVNGTATLVPTAVVNGTFTAADTGFLKITENVAPDSSGAITAQNPPLTGAWAVEIPGAGVLANLLNVEGGSVRAAPVAMAENTVCPSSSPQSPFLYVTVPNASLTQDTADYGNATIVVQGSAINFSTQPYLIGPVQQSTSSATGGCSITILGALTAYPLNSFGNTSNLELISIAPSGLLVSYYFQGTGSSSAGAFGGGTGVIGVAEPSTPVNVSSVIGAQYGGFLYAPLNNVAENYDITVLASAFGDDTATSQACSALQSSLAANNGQGAGTVRALPSANSLFGGEFLVSTSNGNVNDPTGASGSENCDVAIDLGQQDSTYNGLFPNATVFIGSDFPPYSASNPWICSDTGSTCAVAFPAAAIVGQVQGQYVIFVVASSTSSPPARLPDSFGGRPTQPVGIYLFQKTQ